MTKERELAEYAQLGDIESMKECLDNGVNIDGDDPLNIPIVHAVGFNQLEVVKFLVNNGAKLNRKSHMGQSLVELAVTLHNLGGKYRLEDFSEMIKYLESLYEFSIKKKYLTGAY